MSTTRVQTGRGLVHLAGPQATTRGKPWPNCKNPYRGYGSRGQRYGFVPSETVLTCELCQNAELSQ